MLTAKHCLGQVGACLASYVCQNDGLNFCADQESFSNAREAQRFTVSS